MKRRLPLSLLRVGAALPMGMFTIIDGNVESEAESKVVRHLEERPECRFLGITVMPGEQIKGGLEISRTVRAGFPHVKIIWGGFFPSQFPDTVLESGYVDIVVRGQGEDTLREILNQGINGELSGIAGVSYNTPDGIKHSPERYSAPQPYDKIFPYESLEVKQYFNKTPYGSRTIYHNSSMGCPHQCKFCSIKYMYSSLGWQPDPINRTFETIDILSKRYGADSIFFVDADFFPDKKRALRIAAHLGSLKMTWKAYGRVDKLCSFSQEEWRYLSQNGLRALFVGAESASTRIHSMLAKGLNGDLILSFVDRCGQFSIVPDMSFIMGIPGETEEDLAGTVKLIRKIKSINKATNIIIFIYTPFTPLSSVLQSPAQMPQSLEEWCHEKWQQFCFWNPSDSWQDPERLKWIRDFRTVLYYRFPKLSDKRFQGGLGMFLRIAAMPRYYLQYYRNPFELKFLERKLNLIQIG